MRSPSKKVWQYADGSWGLDGRNGLPKGVKLIMRQSTLFADNIHYTFTYRGKTIFDQHDFRPALCAVWDSLECCLALLDFLCLRPGDTDREYFENYSALQRWWATSTICECTQLVCYELQNPTTK